MHLRELLDREHNPVNGYSEEDDQVVVFVKEKLPLDQIMAQMWDPLSPWLANDLIPEEVNGKKTDVVEIGDVEAQSDRKNYRPLIGGCEIAPTHSRYVGTAGVVVSVPEFMGRLLIGKSASFKRLLDYFNYDYNMVDLVVTNQHVVSNDVWKNAVGTTMQQSGAAWGKPIGKVVWSKPISFLEPNVIDCALIKLDDVEVDEYKVLPDNQIQGHTQPHRGMSVCKRGRTTEFTEGECLGTNATIRIKYGGGHAEFNKCKVFSRMSAGGDSGSIIFKEDTGEVVSLLFAGSDKATIGCDIAEVVKQTGVDF